MQLYIWIQMSMYMYVYVYLYICNIKLLLLWESKHNWDLIWTIYIFYPKSDNRKVDEGLINLFYILRN